MRAFLVILAVLAAGGSGWYLGTRFSAQNKSTSSTESSAADRNESPVSSKTIRGQGKFEPASGLIKIVAPMGERILELTEQPIGGTVSIDEVLVTLQSRMLREKDLELAKARRADALKNADFETQQGKYKLDSAKLAVAEANASDEKIANEARKIDLLERQLDAAERLLIRLREFQTNPTTSDLIGQTEVDKQQLLVEQLTIQKEQAKLDIEMAQKSAARAKEIAVNNLQAIEYSLANAAEAIPRESLDAAVAMAQTAFDMTQIRSPIKNATILDITVREGDAVANKPVMILGDTSEMLCVAEINDQFLDLIQTNQQARITSTALSRPVTGKVVSKGVMIGPPSLVDPNPFASVDRRTGTVIIKLDDPAIAAKLVNLQVEVEIEVEPH